MKQNLFKTWLMLLCLFIGIGSAWAEEATIIFASGTNSGTNYYFQNTSGSITDVLSFSSAKNSSTTNPAYNANSSELRLYGHNNSSANGGSITLTAVDGVTFTGFELTVSSATTSAYTAGTNSPVSLSYSSSKATVSNLSCSTLKFQNKNASTTQFKIKSIKVTYTTNGGGGGDPNPTTYTVTVANNIANGTVTASPTSATEGTEVTLTATPATGYEFGSWDVKDASSNAITVTNNKFTMPAANVNVSATFNAIQGGGETGGDETIVTFDNLGFTSWGKSASFSGSTYDELSQTKSDVVFDYTRGSGSTYANTTSIRFYKDNKLKFTAPKGYKITSIVWTGSSFKNDVTTDVETCTSTTSALSWSGNASSVTFTRPSAATSYATLSSVSVTIIADTPPTPTDKTLVSISATGTPATFWKGDAFNHEGITVTATWDDETTTDVTSFCSYTGYDMSTAGDQAVIVTYLEKTATYGINIKTIANTQETAYTVAEAKSLIDAGKDLTTQVYVKGIVSQIVTPWNGQNSNITYNISDDGETTGLQFQLFRCATNGGEVGDAVVAKGTMTFYSQTSTYEFTSGNTIVDIQKPAAKTITALEISGTPTKTTYNVGDAFETAGLVVTATYSDETTAEITTGFEWEIDYGTGNEALVAGATSVDVMVYTDEVMSEVYTVNGLTVTVPVTLTSIAVSGTPTKTEYYAGDAFETAGLVVTGTYSDSHQETITEGIEWNIDPETLTLGTTSVDVIAGVGSIVSEVYTVNGLTVTKPDFETVTYDFSSFTSGQSVELTDLDGFVITLKSNGGTNPAWSSSQARVYAKGSLTVKANNAIIKSIEYDYVVNKNSKGVSPTIDGVEGTTDAGTWDVESKTWTGADEEVTFSTSGSAGNIGFTKLIIKYVESSKIETSLAWSANEATVTIGANDNVFPTLTTTPADLAGVTYESSNTEVATIAEDGTITLIKEGETTITANYAGNAEYASATPASYTLTVIKAPFVPTPAAEGYEAVNFAALYSSVTTNATVEDYEGTSLAMVFAKPQGSNTPTKYYNAGTSVRAYAGNTITITGAEDIKNIDIVWSAEKGEDTDVRIEGLETTSAVVTFSKTCSFTKITVSYKGSNSTLVATDGENYYATFSSDKSVKFIDAEVSTVEVVDGKLSIQEVADKRVPAGNAVLIKSASPDVNYYFVDKDEDFENNNLVPTTTTGQFMSEADDNYYYKLAYGDNTNKEKLGFFWGAADGSGKFNVKAGGAVLVVPQSVGGAVRGFSFDGNNGVVTGLNNLNGLNNTKSTIYNLQGQRISKALKGVNIVNGRKVIR